MNKKFTKKDIILISLLLFLAIFIYLLNIMTDTKDEKQVIVHVDGKIAITCPLDEDRTIEINGGTNILKLSDGEAYMIEADCPDHICIQQGSISKNKESIICLPNRVVVEIQDTKENDVDMIVN